MAIELTELDEYFCGKYANYDKICVLPGYRMPKMQDSKIGEDGLTYAYTLPSETMSLSRQENKAEILKELKNQAFDATFSFSFHVQPLWKRMANAFRKNSPGKTLRAVLKKHGIGKEEAREALAIDNEVWNGIYKGTFVPAKNTVLSLALTAQLTTQEVDALFSACEYQWDYTLVKDTVLSYLIENRIYNEDLIRSAFEEYHVENMFIKW